MLCFAYPKNLRHASSSCPVRFGHFGRFGANGSDGDLAFHLRTDRTGVLRLHLNAPRADLIATNAVLGPDGAAFANARDLSTGVSRLVTGSFGPSGFVGSIPSLNLAFSATKSAAGSVAAGYYAVPALAGPTGSAYAIVGSDGRALFLPQSGTSVDGGAAALDASGRLSVTTAAGAKFTLALTGAGGLTVTGQDSGFAATSFAGLRDGILRTDRLANISTRGRAGAGDDLMIAGFVLTGSAPRPVLVRAVGPSLGAFGVSGTLTDPRLELYLGSTRSPPTTIGPAPAISRPRPPDWVAFHSRPAAGMRPSFSLSIPAPTQLRSAVPTTAAAPPWSRSTTPAPPPQPGAIPV